MAQVLSEPAVEDEIRRLADPDPQVRLAAIRQIVSSRANAPEVISALTRLATEDMDPHVAKAAGTAVEALSSPVPEVSPTRDSADRSGDFWAGLFGWFLMNGVLYLMGTFMIGLILFPLNIIVLFVLLWRKRAVGLGMLTAIAVNLVIALAIGATGQALCAIPFFIR